MDENLVDLVVTSSPHIRDKAKVPLIMRGVLIALMPATIAGLYFFGVGHTLGVIIVSILSAVVAEYLSCLIFRTKATVYDLSAAVTGLLLALTLPPSSPYWMVAVGAFVAIILGKWIFGGIGSNPFNPALVGRAFLMISWPTYMTIWVKPFTQSVFPPTNAITTATPLSIIKLRGFSELLAMFDGSRLIMYKSLFIGNVAGSIGETSVLLLLISGIALIAKKIIDWRIPAGFIGTVFVLSAVFNRDPIFSILSGGLFLGAFFMATDYSSSPIIVKGRLWYGISLGVLTVIFRQFGASPEGVMFSILIMNCFVPFFDKMLPRVYGHLAPKRRTNI